MDVAGEPTDARDRDGWVAMEIVTVVAEAEGVDETRLLPPLAEVIDTDALEQVVGTAADGTVVEFEYRGWVVEVRVGGTVTLRES